jgi:hypothetical protein
LRHRLAIATRKCSIQEPKNLDTKRGQNCNRNPSDHVYSRGLRLKQVTIEAESSLHGIWFQDDSLGVILNCATSYTQNRSRNIATVGKELVYGCCIETWYN